MIPDTEVFLYVLRAAGLKYSHGPITKIGVSRFPWLRLIHLRREHKIPFEIAHIFPFYKSADAFSVEKFVKAQFKNHRVLGYECFGVLPYRICNAVREFVKNETKKAYRGTNGRR